MCVLHRLNVSDTKLNKTHHKREKYLKRRIAPLVQTERGKTVEKENKNGQKRDQLKSSIFFSHRLSQPSVSHTHKRR